MSVWGFLISGLLCSYWFKLLNSIFPPEGLTLAGALKKVFVNQLIMSPGLNGLFFAFTTFTRPDIASSESSRRAFLGRKLKQDLLPTIKKSCVYWGTIQLFNFLVVPQQYTLLFTNIGFLLWTIYLSLVGFRKA